MSGKDEHEAPASGPSKKHIIILVVAALLLVGGSVGVTVMMLGKSDQEATAKEKGGKKATETKAKGAKDEEDAGHEDGKDKAKDAKDAKEEPAAEAEEPEAKPKHKAKAEEEDAEEEDDDEDEAEKGHQFYVDFAPAFVVNLPSRDKASRTRFLKVDVSAASKEEKIEEEVKKHMPAIRNKLVMLFSKQIYEDLISAEGKETLRKQALSEVQKALKKAAGKKLIKDLYFTSFVMQ